MAEEGFRYLIAPRVEAPEIVFFPYWRLRGTLYCRTPGGVTHRFVDANLPAAAAAKDRFGLLQAFPATLGVRPQAMTLRFVTPDACGGFARATMPAAHAAAILASRYGQEGEADPSAREFIGESMSLIYAPFFVRGKLFDAVLGQPVPPGLRDVSLASLPLEESPPVNVRFIPALCPRCGWELAGERDALAFLCERCSALWYAGARELEPLATAVLDDGVDASLYLPFWRLDVARDGSRFACWIPAFKIRPGIFLRLASTLTQSGPAGMREGELPRLPAHPVTLALSEAKESVRWVLETMRAAARRPPEPPAESPAARRGVLLAYLPFHQRTTELENPAHGLVVERNALRVGREL